MSHANILYVEDYEQVLFTVKQLLELEGWSVETCRDGESALKRLETREAYDLVLLDAKLTGMSGLDLLREIRSHTHRRRTPVIMFTATECEHEATEAGADAFLKKPSGIRDLIPTAERLLNNSDGQESSRETTPPAKAESHRNNY